MAKGFGMVKLKVTIGKRLCHVEVADDGSYRVFLGGDYIEITRNLSPKDRKKVEARLPRYVIAIKRKMPTTDPLVVGYFIADDQGPTKDKDGAVVFRSMKEAKANLNYCDNSWDLDAMEYFEVVVL